MKKDFCLKLPGRPRASCAADCGNGRDEQDEAEGGADSGSSCSSSDEDSADRHVELVSTLPYTCTNYQEIRDKMSSNKNLESMKACQNL